MNLKAIKQLHTDATVRFDDQLTDAVPVAWDVFGLGQQLEHWVLTADDQLQVGQHELTTHHGQLFLDDEPAPMEQLDLPALKVISRSHIKTYLVQPTAKQLVVQAAVGDLSLATAGVAQFKFDGTTWQLTLVGHGATAYVDRQAVADWDGEFAIGTQLYLDGILVERRDRFWKVTPLETAVQVNLEHLTPVREMQEFPPDFPDFRRSPRIFLRPPTHKIKVENPPQAQTMPKNSVMQMIIPPLGMVAVYGLMSLFTNYNSFMMLGMGSMTVLTAGFSVSNYFTQKKEVAHKNREAKQAYRDYLLGMAGELQQVKAQQQAALQYNFPTIDQLIELVNCYDARIYERLRAHEDFLTVSLGHGTIPASYQIDYQQKAGQVQTALERRVAQKVVAPAQTLTHAPITVNLAQTTLGLAGPKASLRTSLQTLLFQIASWHSYHDVQMVALINEQEYDQYWQEWRWLPHFQLDGVNLRGLVHNAQTRDMVLNAVYQLLVQRRQAQQERAVKDGDHFKPHLVLVIEEESWLNGHNLNEFLNQDLSVYGVTVIWAKETTNALPETVTTLVEYRSSKLATLVNVDQVYLNQNFEPHAISKRGTLEAAIKRLANLNHIEVEQNSIPESVTFLDLYHVKRAEELAIMQRWQQADTSKTLAAPLGLRGKDDVVELNLHERAHGPHGLIAGTTGSGKSELLQSYMLSLAVNFAPEDVGFLPIDYKGGGMANLFANLPHLMGMITNLDGASTDRALKSIHAELERRQRYFRQFGVNNINAYTKLYKEGKEHPTDDSYPHEPLPHLFLISDEFAELKANEPDFMDELVSTARIGRSLGVHLILATQKPNGVVSEQIWSNSRFKIALKVSDPADSKEIIHTPDAASITQVGRAYLQVGNNEIYELFQSAYSSAAYNPTDNQHAQRDQRLWLINQLGQAELLTRDLSEIDEPKESEIQTQLEAVVDEIAKDAKQAQVKMPMKPWLPPLATHIVSPMIDWSQEWQANRNLVVPFAKLDIPSQQKQAELKFDLTKMNSTVIIGSAGYGKSMALQTIVTNLARLNNPEQVQFYLLDFGTNGLLPLTKLPHVGDIAGFDNLEKLHKLLKQLMAMLEQRKTLFQEKGVSNLSQYEALVGEHLPVVMIAVDAYDTVVENDKQREIIDNVLTQLLREGQAVGMYTILTANRYSSFRVGITSNLTTRIGLYMVDENAPRDMLGRSALKQSPIPGRGQLEVDGEMLAIQVYSPTQAVESLATVKAIDDLGETMTEAWHGKLPERVPMLPVVVDEEFFMAQSSVVKMLQNGSLPVALSNETTEAIGFIPDQMHYYVLMTETPIQEATTEKIIIKDLQMLQQQYDDVAANLIDFDGSLLQYDSERMQVVGEEEIANFMNALQKEINERRLSGNTEKWFIYIPKFEYFSTKVTMDQATIETMLRQCWQVGIYLIFQTNQLEFSRSLNNFAKALKKNLSAGSLGSRIVEQQLVKANYQPNESILPEDGINMFVGRKISLARLITRWSDE